MNPIPAQNAASEVYLRQSVVGLGLALVCTKVLHATAEPRGGDILTFNEAESLSEHTH